MLRSRTLASLCAFFVSTTVTFAQSSTEVPAPTYVTVAFNTAVLQTAEAQHAFSDLQTKFTPRQTHLQQLNSQVEALKKQIADNAASLSDAERSARVHNLDIEEHKLQRESEDFKGDTDSASREVFQAVAQKLYTFLQDYAKQHAYALVIDRGSEADPIVWYSAANVDITADLLKAYNLKAAALPAEGHTSASPHLPQAPTPH